MSQPNPQRVQQVEESIWQKPNETITYLEHRDF